MAAHESCRRFRATRTDSDPVATDATLARKFTSGPELAGAELEVRPHREYVARERVDLRPGTGRGACRSIVEIAPKPDCPLQGATEGLVGLRGVDE